MNNKILLELKSIPQEDKSRILNHIEYMLMFDNSTEDIEIYNKYKDIIDASIDRVKEEIFSSIENSIPINYTMSTLGESVKLDLESINKLNKAINKSMIEYENIICDSKSKVIISDLGLIPTVNDRIDYELINKNILLFNDEDMKVKPIIFDYKKK